jgi:energy-coupling factor transport system ATP-binding protein
MSVVAALERVTYRYPEAGTDALADCSLDVRAGEVLVLAGPSGGGKSTVLRCLAGLVPSWHGGRFAGDVRRPERVGLLFQDPEAGGVHADVLRDVAFGLENRGVARERLAPEARAALAAAGVAHLEGRRLDELSGGERQRVALAGVLALQPQLLLLDEPTAMVDDEAAEALLRHVRELARAGTAVVVAEHRLDRVADHADRVLGVDGGRVGPAPARPSLRPAHPAATDGPAVLVVRDVEVDRGDRRVLRGASLEVARGEVVALMAPSGAGKSTLLRAVAGLEPTAGGAVLLGGDELTDLAPQARFPRLALVVQDPGRHLLTERVRDEVAFGLTAGTPAVTSAIAALDLEPHAERHPRDLSVGERERVVLAACLAAEPEVLLLDEPTRGMDPARRGALAALLRGRTALVATHDPEFAAAAADRVLRLVDGRVQAAAIPIRPDPARQVVPS